MTTLRVIVDQIVAPIPGGIGRYTEELTRELIRTAPRGCSVSGIVSSSPEADYELIEILLPGLDGLFKSALARRELELAWQHGFTRLPGSGMVHATGLFAPLFKHDRINNVGEQIAVTIHDVIPWTNPEALSTRRLGWYKAMAKRAYKYADAVVAPTHAVASQLSEIHDFGDRVRVIGGAVSSKLTLPVDADARAARLDLPERFILSVGTLQPHKGIAPLIQAMAHPQLRGHTLLIAGPEGSQGLDVVGIAAEAGLTEDRVRALGYLADADLAVALDRASVFAFPSLAEGFGTVLDDPALAGRMGFAGRDRARTFSWTDSAEKVWQLHADL